LIDVQQERGLSPGELASYRDLLLAARTDKILNSSKVFTLGILLKKLLPNKQLEEIFPQNIRDIIFSEETKTRFFLSWKKWNLYVSREASGFLQSWGGKDYFGLSAQFKLSPVNDGEYFTLVSAQWENNFLSVGPARIVNSRTCTHPGPEGHFLLTPKNAGEYFEISTKAWPKCCLYIKGILGIVHSGERSESGRSHIRIKMYERIKQ